MVSKIAKKIQGWQGKLLSFGGKATLIKSVFQSVPIHLLSVMYPPKGVIDQIEMIFSNFLWGEHNGKNKYH